MSASTNPDAHANRSLGESLPGLRGCAAIAFITGIGVLGLEVTAARILMPWFGASTLVWSNVIGVTLGAVALGNIVGGRIADRSPSLALLATLLVLSGGLAALFPYLVPFVSRAALPTDLPLEAAFPLLNRGSLYVCLVALAPPLVLLGAISPFLVRGGARSGQVGRSSGMISGMATLGSLIGTWGPIHYTIPWLGSKRTCLLAGVLLIVSGVSLFLRMRRLRGAAVGGLVVGAVAFLGASTGAAPGRGAVDGESLVEVESRYQYSRVERRDRETALKLNEGLDSFHSFTIDGQLLTERYYDPFLLLPQTINQVGDRFDVLILGFAAGTFARQLLDLYSKSVSLRILGVELDPAIPELGLRYFGLPRDPRLELVTDQDARVYLDHSREQFELILVDVYANQVYVPFHTCSAEFFGAAHARLTAGGVLAANLGGYSFDDRPMTAIRNTAASVFSNVSLVRCPNSRNFMLLAGRQRELPDLSGATTLGRSELTELVSRFSDPTLRRDFAFDTRLLVLTDDTSPIEEMANLDFAARAVRAFEAVHAVRSR